ncbi:MAG TPA: GNAT family N-acetyltransferase [Acidimicrobiales bacterium]|nr:GNAT family N-acetyltransferase [Acidimicrobiales bacterium]
MERIVEAVGDGLTPTQLYDLLRLRAEVFVVEQGCAYLDPDGLDLEPTTRHLWVEDDGRVVAALRIVGNAIGRVVTASPRRSQGLASALVERAVDGTPRPVRLNAQSHLVGWYEGLGFVVDGAGFVEDGIPHTPMIRRDEP